MRYAAVCCAVLALAVLGMQGRRSACAQEAGVWSTPVNLSESDTASYYPDIAVDSAGHVYVVWGEYSHTEGEGRPDKLMLRIWDGQAWTQANDIAVGGHLPQIGVDSRGRLHVLSVGPYIRAWAQQNPLNAQSWVTGPVWYMRSPYWPDMVVDAQDRIHVVFRDTMEYDEDRTVSDRVCVTGCRGIYYVRSENGGYTWSNPLQLDTPEGDAETPRIAVDDHGGVYVVWSDTNAGESAIGISFSCSVDGGATWSVPHRLPVGDVEGYGDPQIAVDSEGTIHIVWAYRTRNALGYIRSSDGGRSWSEVENLPFTLTGAYSFGLAVDSLDNLHLVGQLAGQNMPAGVYHLLRPEGGDWSVFALVSRNPCSEGAADAELVISHGNQLHAVWYDRVECELGYVGPSGRGEVFYSTMTTDAPALPLATLPPMPTSTPTPTPTQQPSPSPTTPPSVVPTWQPTVGQEQQAAPALPPLAVGIGLSVTLIVLVIAGWSLRHRAL